MIADAQDKTEGRYVNFTLKKGMRLRDIPEVARCAFDQPFCLSSQPEFRFHDGKFYKVTYLEWDDFEAVIPFGTEIILDTNSLEFSHVSAPLTKDSQLKLAAIAMHPKGYGITGKLAQMRARKIIWC